MFHGNTKSEKLCSDLYVIMICLAELPGMHLKKAMSKQTVFVVM